MKLGTAVGPFCHDFQESMSQSLGGNVAAEEPNGRNEWRRNMKVYSKQMAIYNKERKDGLRAYTEADLMSSRDYKNKKGGVSRESPVLETYERGGVRRWMS